MAEPLTPGAVFDPTYIAAKATEMIALHSSPHPDCTAPLMHEVVTRLAAASQGDEGLDVDEVAADFHDARYGVFGVHDGTGSPPFVEPVVACGYCRKAAGRYVYAAQQRALRAALAAEEERA